MDKEQFTAEVEAIHLQLYGESERYRSLLAAVYDKDAVEGSLETDDIAAGIMIRTRAIGDGKTDIATAKLAEVIRALRVVMRRYGLGRKQRRLGGEAA